MHTYRVKLKHDGGVITITQRAENIALAINLVISAEMAPIASVLSAEKVGERSAKRS